MIEGLFVLLLCAFQPHAMAYAATFPQTGQPAATGRVVTTITTLDGTVRLPGVQIELRTSSDSTVLAQTSTGGAGLVTFPDVPPGNYIVRAVRAGFVSKDSAAFQVRAHEVARCCSIFS